ncbi:hypothetical protein MKW92_017198 [Papaver armeniacum]|nr:hypothetical protein MKW92_040384 [Papaver armeniacum]KAI3967297.1 hypothetical protein MKW92_017198 [Papaver armeniacum]
MDAMKMRLFGAATVMIMAVTAVQNVAAADAPAPGPSGDAAGLVPAIFASASAVAFALFF